MFILGTNTVNLALGLVGGMLALIILVVTSIYVVCRVKGLTLKKVMWVDRREE